MIDFFAEVEEDAERQHVATYENDWKFDKVLQESTVVVLSFAEVNVSDIDTSFIPFYDSKSETAGDHEPCAVRIVNLVCITEGAHTEEAFYACDDYFIKLLKHIETGYVDVSLDAPCPVIGTYVFRKKQ